MGNQSEAADLAALLAQGSFMFLRLANALLGADLAFSGFAPDAIEAAGRYKAAGARLTLEISADKRGGAIVALIAIDANGERIGIGSVSERDAAAVN
jgi:hypothetical protein